MSWSRDWWMRDGTLRLEVVVDLYQWMIGIAFGERDVVVNLVWLSLCFENWDEPPPAWTEAAE